MAVVGALLAHACLPACLGPALPSLVCLWRVVRVVCGALPSLAPLVRRGIWTITGDGLCLLLLCLSVVLFVCLGVCVVVGPLLAPACLPACLPGASAFACLPGEILCVWQGSRAPLREPDKITAIFGASPPQFLGMGTFGNFAKSNATSSWGSADPLLGGGNGVWSLFLEVILIATQ